MGHPSAPAVFSALSYEAALDASAREGKLLVVDATAAWCGPCKKMDEATWPDPDVIAWIEKHAIAIQIDVDEQKGLAKNLAVRAMPTVVVFRDRAEFDRVCGLQKPAELLAWLDGILLNQTAETRMREDVARHPDDMHLRYRFADRLVDAGKCEEATELYLWLWQHMLEHEPAMVGVRCSYMAGDIHSLVEQYPPARRRFADLRDSTEPGTADTDADKIVDWIDLNAILGESAKTLEWVDGAGSAVVGRADFEKLRRLRIIPLLIQNGRWADAGRMESDPLAKLEREWDVLQRARDVPESMGEMRAQMLEWADRAGLEELDFPALTQRFHRSVLDEVVWRPSQRKGKPLVHHDTAAPRIAVVVQPILHTQ